MSEFDGTVKDGDEIRTFKRVIQACTGGRPLLTRYHILHTPWFGIYLHHFHQSDDDRAFHDHPWSFVSILLSDGYWELTPGPQGKRVDWISRWSIIRRPAKWRHIVRIRKPMWTLVFRGPEKRMWGFIVPGKGWMSFKRYGREFCS